MGSWHTEYNHSISRLSTQDKSAVHLLKEMTVSWLALQTYFLLQYDIKFYVKSEVLHEAADGEGVKNNTIKIKLIVPSIPHCTECHLHSLHWLSVIPSVAFFPSVSAAGSLLS